MKISHLLTGAAFACAPMLAINAHAHAHEQDKTAPHALDHAPIGVMADHRHKQGEWMFSYRYMHMNMDSSRNGTATLTPDEIATQMPNRFFGNPMQPPTLRVVPTDMNMGMHMVGAMYGLSDRITLMVMGSVISKDMHHITYQGGIGTNVLGSFNTETHGIGDTTVTAIIGLDNRAKTKRQFNLNLGLSLPTGSLDETGQILTPMGMTPSPRLPYPMQIGSGTYDFKPALTYQDRNGKWGWGGQTSVRIPLGKNDEGYRYGTLATATSWLAYEPFYWASLSGRVKASTQGAISGMDTLIMAPVQTANPDNQGGDTIDLLFGVNFVGQNGALRGHRVGLEVGLPLYRNLNGPQLETDMTITVGWQKSF